MTVHRVERTNFLISAKEAVEAIRLLAGDEYLVEGICVRCGKEQFLKHHKTKLGEMKLCRECVNDLESKKKIRSAFVTWEEWEKQLDELSDCINNEVNIK